ncbi:TAT-variant-translocated molybdopterin oxidoreductase [Vicingaceae bacterium]|nr:TAT-variant-translocated molybdopterin oxidoreductase [Vicingaceae bacterium]
MANTKKYWKGLEQLDNDSKFVESSNNEFAEQLPVTEFLGNKEDLEDATTTRRDFLKYLGFGVAAASLAACETPVTKAIPYLNKPEEITPGLANYYASTYFDGNDYAPILVKTREGRPIHIVGNKESVLTKGAINARVNSSVLSLYDNNRLKTPSIKGEDTTWATIDNRLGKELKAAKSVRVLTGSVISPSAQSAIDQMIGSSVNGEETSSDNKHVVVDAISYSGILEANAESFGKAVIPTYNFEKAKTIVSVGADFMGNWLDALQYVNDYAQTRKPSNDWMSKTFQFEASMSLSGTNADVRVPVKPSEYGAIISSLYAHLGGNGGAKTTYDVSVKEAASALKASKGESIVVCGSNDKNVQVIVNAINELLGNFGKTVDVNKVSNSKQGLDSEMTTLIADMNAGKVDALLIQGVDPVFTMGADFAKAMKKVKTTVSFANKMDDTAAACMYVCPSNHALESWSDANPVTGHYSLGQPTISPLFDTRQAEESILKWSGNDSSYHDYIQKYWEANIFPQSGALMFSDFWNKVLHDGVVEVSTPASEEVMTFAGDVSKAVSVVKAIKGNGIELELVQNMGVGAGVGADNPWLQEMPDPITKITWDNYVTMNPSEMEEAGYEIHFGQEHEMNVLDVTANGNTIQLPVIAQPGQKRGTIGIALGYGKKVGNQEEVTGANAYPLVTKTKTGVSYYASGVTATNVELDTPYHIACTQTQQTVMGRSSVIRETTLDTYKKGDRAEFNPIWTLLSGETDEHGHQKEKALKEFDLWGDQPVKVIGHRWGMSIDMNSCTGCSACVTSCVSENNIAVIGKDQVRRGRIMHWMRIDRYYSSEHQPLGDVAGTHSATKEAEDLGAIGAYTSMESPADNPSVVHQPMMCQHCNHAGCETVCPVAATTHSNEGLNMMAYNRCIGTRYCANNCAYKVRRFNWFNYIAYSKFTDINPSQDDLGRMVLNPDVVVRSRGVMEKCSLCVQRIQEGKLDAKKAGAKVQDGAIQTACSSACPTNAITFGDHNDKDSKLAAERESDRSYRVIEEVGQDGNVYYQTKVRNLKA